MTPRAAARALVFLVLLGAAGAVSLKRATEEPWNFDYNLHLGSNSVNQNFGGILLKLEFDGDIKVGSTGSSSEYLEDFVKALPGQDMSVLAGEGIDVTLKCGEGEFSAKAGSHHEIFGLSGEHAEMFTGAPVTWLWPVAPQPDAVARTVSALPSSVKSAPIFSSAPFAKNEIYFALLDNCGGCFEYDYYRNDPDGADAFYKMVQQFWDQLHSIKHSSEGCTVTIGGGPNPIKIFGEDGSEVESAGVRMDWAQPTCSVSDVQTVLPLLRSTQDRMEASKGLDEFKVAHKTIAVIKTMDAFLDCQNVMMSMMNWNEVDTWVPNTRMCVADYQSDAWGTDPCCNGALAFTQCCAPRDVQSRIWAITDTTESDLCTPDPADQCMLDNVLVGWQIMHRMKEDPADGCRAQRELATDWQEHERLMKFWNTCHDILFQGKTKAGLATCSDDSQCYTKCSKKDNRCSQPWWDFEEPFVACAIDNMDPILINYFRSKFQVKEDDGPTALADAIFTSAAREDCTGETADQGACLLSMSEEQCTDNIFNLQHTGVWVDSIADTKEECDAKGSNYLWVSQQIYEDWNMDTNGHDEMQPLGCINTDDECRDIQSETGCNEWWSIHNAWGTPCNCTRMHPNFAPLEMCRPGESCEYHHDSLHSHDLGTAWLADSPDSRKCKIANFWPADHNTTCDASCQCNLFHGILKDQNGWSSDQAEPGRYFRYKETWEWREVEGGNGEWALQKIAAGNQSFCEWEKKCAHRPWDTGVSESQCLAADGSNFCAECDGPYCWELSRHSKCIVNEGYNKNRCLARGGSWKPPQDSWADENWCWECCRLDNVTESWTEETCYPEPFCVSKTWTWTDDVSGHVHEWTDRGFCEWRPFCYSEVMTNESNVTAAKAACDTKRKQNMDANPDDRWMHSWPRWYSSHEPETDDEHHAYWNDMHDRFSHPYDGYGYWQDFYPAQGMCVEGVQWYQDDSGTAHGEGNFALESCAAAGNTWYQPRRFEPGQWDTEATCKRGVCNTEPWNWELADSGTCETDKDNSGGCSRECKVCETHWDSSVREWENQQLCHADWLLSQANCTKEGYTWSESHDVCYTLKPADTCTTKGTVYKCSDLDKTSCTSTGLQARPWYNGTMNLLKCHLNNYGRCPNKGTCESGGECNDWTYEVWDGETQPKCRVPWTEGDDWGGPNWESCDGSATGIDGAYSYGVWDDACVWSGLTKDQCTEKGGVQVARAETEAQCTQFKGCFHTIRGYITAVPENHCKDHTKCSEDDHEWRDVLDWRGGVWTPAQMDPREWLPRAMTPKNKWGKIVAFDSIHLMVEDAVYSVFAEAYRTEAVCEIEPIIQMIMPLACACDPGKGSFSEQCSEVKTQAKQAVIAEKTAWQNLQKRQVITSSLAAIVPSVEVLRNSAETGSNATDKVQTVVSMISAATQRLCVDELSADVREKNDPDDTPPPTNVRRSNKDHPMRRYSRRSLGAVKNQCEQYEVVKNTDGQVVGQIIGNGMVIKGIKNGDVKVCVKTDPNVPRCLAKFKVNDIALGTADNKPGVPLQKEVEVEGSRLCTTVTLPATGELTLYPVKRTKNMLPYVKFAGDRVKVAMTLSYQSKEIFLQDETKLIAFMDSIAQALNTKGVVGLTGDDVEIISVCDSSGCKQLSARRALGDGSITVTFRVNANGVEAGAITEAISSPDFAGKFVDAMAQNGQPGLTASVTEVGVEIDANVVNTGLIIGLSVGGALVLCCVVSAVTFFVMRKKKSVPKMPGPLPPVHEAPASAVIGNAVVLSQDMDATPAPGCGEA